MNCRVTISFDADERTEIEAAAREDRLTVSAFVAAHALTAARHQASRAEFRPLREALLNLNLAAAQLQRAGTNFNQAVAALNATGQQPGNLLQYARYTASVVHRVDEAAARVQQQLP